MLEKFYGEELKIHRSNKVFDRKSKVILKSGQMALEKVKWTYFGVYLSQRRPRSDKKLHQICVLKSYAKSDFSVRDSNIKDSHSRLEN